MSSRAAGHEEPEEAGTNVEIRQGKTIDGRYLVLRCVSSSVCCAHDQQRDRPVWLRLIQGERLLKRLRGEEGAGFKQASSLGSGTISILRFGQHESACYVASKYVPGRLLAEELDRHLFSTEEAVAMVRQLLQVLQRGHKRGIVHRGISPDSVVLAGSNQVHLLEYGIDARWKCSSANGTAVAYQAPEQVDEDELSIGPATDIYSIGVLLFELLSGTVPFKSDSRETLDELILFQAPAPIRKLAPEVPVILEEIVEQCLAKELGKRFSSLAELNAALATSTPEKIVQSPPVRAGRKSTKFSVRAAAVVVFLLIFLPVAYIVVFQRPGEYQRLYSYEDIAEATGLSRDEIVQCIVDEAIPAPSNDHSDGGRPHWEASSIEPWLAKWEVDRDDPIRTVLHGANRYIHTVAVSPDGRAIAAGDDSGAVRLWDFRTGKEQWRFAGNSYLTDKKVLALRFSRDSESLAVCTQKLLLKLDAETGKKIDAPKPLFPLGRNATICPDGSTACVYQAKGSEPSGAHVYKLDTLRETAFIGGYFPSIATDADGERVFLGSNENEQDCRLWQPSSRNVFEKLSGPWDRVIAATFSNDGSLLAASGGPRHPPPENRSMSNDEVVVWENAGGDWIRKRSLTIGSGWQWSVCFSPDGHYLLTGGRGFEDDWLGHEKDAKNTIRVWDLSDGQVVKQYTGHDDAVLAIEFMPDGRHFVTSGADATVRIWRFDVEGSSSR